MLPDDAGTLKQMLHALNDDSGGTDLDRLLRCAVVCLRYLATQQLSEMEARPPEPPAPTHDSPGV